MPGRRTLGKLCSIRRGNNSSAHVNQEFRTPLILRALRCGILGPAVQLAKWAKPHPARRGWPRYARMFGASRHRSVPSVGISPTPAVSTRVRVISAARFASKVARSISNVCCCASSLSRQRLLTGPDGLARAVRAFWRHCCHGDRRSALWPMGCAVLLPNLASDPI